MSNRVGHSADGFQFYWFIPGEVKLTADPAHFLINLVIEDRGLRRKG